MQSTPELNKVGDNYEKTYIKTSSGTMLYYTIIFHLQMIYQSSIICIAQLHNYRIIDSNFRCVPQNRKEDFV